MKIKLAFLSSVLVATAAMAAPIQLSLTPEIAIYDRNEVINGLALNIWGENQQHALALGIVNGSTGNSSGFSIALLLNYAESYRGVQWAPINYAREDFLGWQWGLVNYVGGDMRGLQVAFVNYAARLRGVQVGVINYAEAADAGLQIGLINVITENTRWFTGLPEELAPAMVFVNWSF
jgi:hypothetical protein